MFNHEWETPIESGGQGSAQLEERALFKVWVGRTAMYSTLPIVVKLRTTTWCACQNRVRAPIPRASKLVNPGWISKVCTWNKFPGIADWASL